jgi:putative phage-type endonuclease
MNEIEQRTEEWFAARLGKVTASRVADVIAKTKTGYAATRDTYMTQLVLERITKTKAEGFTSAAMQWGVDQEPFARGLFEATTGQMVQEVGFMPHPLIEMAGASPDGLLDDGEGMIEIKCPESKGMIETLLTQKIPQRYLAQMQFQMACADRKYCQYVVFDPRMPPKAQLFVKRVDRDNKFIAEIEAEIVKFLAEVDAQVNQLNAIIESK